jgi:hypothetical protein
VRFDHAMSMLATHVMSDDLDVRQTNTGPSDSDGWCWLRGEPQEAAAPITAKEEELLSPLELKCGALLASATSVCQCRSMVSMKMIFFLWRTCSQKELLYYIPWSLHCNFPTQA